ncbi:DUF4037 domain-containing protein [Salirhabdus sp. Marseille-P4669]|uniref:DUF4037 domain-containing protein n=1 Tax=Salirhabdus sp. Marseille-P4669 TaxID=2042310 RepID=UPI000C7A831C|nr:DUF4037 domain-containing protein [Salirhabdus sp. Marseille-P4669]
MDLKKLAHDIANVYMENSKVEAVLLGGSVARNWHDEFSDIELFVFWKIDPTDHDRKYVINRVNGEVIDFYDFEDDEWSETYITEGVNLEISNFLTTTIEKWIDDVVSRFETDLEKQCLVATIHDGRVFGGEIVIRQLKKKVVKYPQALSQAMINNYLDMGSRWSNREALLSREDWLMLYNVIVSTQTNIMGILFGLNRMYVHHPAFKWQKQSTEKMTLLPNNLVQRLQSVLVEHPKHSVRELENIVQETYELVQKEYPQMDLTPVKEKSTFVRPRNNSST